MYAAVCRLSQASLQSISMACLIRGGTPFCLHQRMIASAQLDVACARTRWGLVARNIKVVLADHAARCTASRACATRAVNHPTLNQAAQLISSEAQRRDEVPTDLDWTALPQPLHERPPLHSCPLTDLREWATAAGDAAAATRDSFVADNGPSSEDLQVLTRQTLAGCHPFRSLYVFVAVISLKL